MTAYIIDIVIVLILAFFAWRGARKGLILTLFGLLGLVVAFFGARFVSGAVYEPVADIIQPGIYQSIKGIQEDFTGDPDLEVDFSGDALIELLEESDLFPGLVELLDGSDGRGSDRYASTAEALSHTLADMLSKVILFALTFVLILLLWFLISRAIDLAFKLPILKAVNLAGGLVIGLLKAIVIVVVLVWIGQLVGWLPAEPTTPILSLFTPGKIAELLNKLVA